MKEAICLTRYFLKFFDHIASFKEELAALLYCLGKRHFLEYILANDVLYIPAFILCLLWLYASSVLAASSCLRPRVEEGRHGKFMGSDLSPSPTLKWTVGHWPLGHSLLIVLVFSGQKWLVIYRQSAQNCVSQESLSDLEVPSHR